ncbi:hypothetical protein KKE34_05110 [Patescibacteria group bacterium]|nr:hypothetical protein [Patescibacteria group bacterium]MBU1885954.1 hypothetical protein [Patescibacteria group bacterium]
MINHIWTVLCRESVIDNQTNNVSLLNVLEQLEINIAAGVNFSKDKDLVVPISFELVSLWSRDDTKKKAIDEINISIIGHDGQKIKTLSKKIEIPKGKKRLRSRFRISGFPVKKSGIYYFVLKINNFKKEIAKIPLEVKIN